MRRLINGASIDLGPTKRRRPPPTFFIYAIGDHEGRFIKFGQAQRPLSRLCDLQSATPLTLKLLAQLRVAHRGEAVGLESLVHEAAARHYVRGEWFHSTPRTLMIVEWMRSTEFEKFKELIKASAKEERQLAEIGVDGVRIRRHMETAGQ